MKLLLIRHGEAEDKEGDIILTERGRNEALCIAEHLSGTHIEKIYVSTLTRAKQTLEPLKKIRKDIPIVESDDIREIYRVLVGGPERDRTPVDREEKDRRRIEQFWDTVCKEEGVIAVFSHGNAIRYLLSKALRLTRVNMWENMLIMTGSISIITINERKTRVEGVNMIDHLPHAAEIFLDGGSTVYHS